MDNLPHKQIIDGKGNEDDKTINAEKIIIMWKIERSSHTKLFNLV